MKSLEYIKDQAEQWDVFLTGLVPLATSLLQWFFGFLLASGASIFLILMAALGISIILKAF